MKQKTPPIPLDPKVYGNKLPKTLPRKAMHTRGRNRGC